MGAQQIYKRLILFGGNPEIFLEEEAMRLSLDTKYLAWASLAVACFRCSPFRHTFSQDDLIRAGAQFQPLSLSRLSPDSCSPSLPSFSFVPSQLPYFWCLIPVLLPRQWRCHPSQKMIVSACSFVQSKKDSKPIWSSKGVLCWLGTLSGDTEGCRQSPHSWANPSTGAASNLLASGG